MIQVEFNDVDLMPFIDHLASLDFKPFEAQIGELMVERTRERLAQGVDPSGAAYAENGGKYGEWKAKHYPGKLPLTLTGEMADKIQVFMGDDGAVVSLPHEEHSWVPGVPKMIKQDPRDLVQIGIGQEDGTRGSAERQIFGLSAEDEDLIMQKFNEAFDEEFA
jgi:phage gpG-like protein